MTNKEAIEILEDEMYMIWETASEKDFAMKRNEAFDMAIEALEQVTFKDLSKPKIEVLKEHHKVCDDCDGFIYDYCSECPIRNKNKDDDAS